MFKMSEVGFGNTLNENTFLLNTGETILIPANNKIIVLKATNAKILEVYY